MHLFSKYGYSYKERVVWFQVNKELAVVFITVILIREASGNQLCPVHFDMMWWKIFSLSSLDWDQVLF